MARRRKRRSKRAPFLSKVKLLAIIGGGAGVFGAWSESDGSLPSFFRRLSMAYTGFNPADGSFQAERLKKGLLPLVIGTGGSYAAAKTGINRYIPFINL